MSYVLTCDVPFNLADLSCAGTLSISDLTTSVVKLSMSDVSVLLTAAVTLWALAFSLRFLYNFLIKS